MRKSQKLLQVINMSPWALNTMRGCKIQNDDIGEIPSLTAIPVSDKQALIAKHLHGVVVFDTIVGVDIEKVAKEYYGVELGKIDTRAKAHDEEMKTYKYFMEKYKDPKIAGQKWAEYKKRLGIKEKPDDKPNTK